MAQSSIEWTEMTWNPTTGCNKISQGCKNCYADRMSKRLKAMGHKKYSKGFRISLHPDTLDIPYTWRKPKIVFVNSMSDLFHEKVPLEYIQNVFKVMNDLPQHVFQVLTKRSERLSELSEFLNWTNNIWMGVSVENSKVIDRINCLRNSGAKTKFLSLEPLIGPLPQLNLNSIDWAIVGGESGPKARLMQKEWVLDIKTQCNEQNVKFFFKQWGGVNKKKTGREIEGRTYDEMPEILQYESLQMANDIGL